MRERDVIVVGGGLAGLTAAVAAAEAGAAVTLLEKTGTLGGSTVLSGGFFAFAGTAQQRALGIEDSAELLERDLLDVGEHRNDPALVAAYARGQAELASWLQARGLVIADVEASSGQSVPRSHRSDPRLLIDALAGRAERFGVELRCSVSVERLLVIDGTVRGVDTDTGQVPGRAVVLACGGFAGSDELLAQHAPGQAQALRVGGAGNTGDGLALARPVGAGVRDLEFVKGTFGTHPRTTSDKHELLLLYYLGAVIVNSDARRYVDESISYKLLGDACLAQRSPVSFQVFDHGVFGACPPGVALFDPRPYLEKGMLLRAADLPSLARLMDVPADALVATVESYNAAVRDGGDEFGRTALVHGGGSLRELVEPPFYAYPSTSVVLATYCGLTVDPHARVTDTRGRPVPGLWAAGELTGGFHGAAYMTGSSLGKAAYFGRVAGRGAAAHPDI